MDSRERVMRAVEFDGPDRIPNGCYWLPGAIDRYGDELEALFREFPKDFHQFVATFSSYVGYKEGVNVDPWGCVWKNINPGVLGRIIEHPLSDWENLSQYELPDPSDLVDFRELEKSIRDSGHDRYILGDSENFFERLHWLRGYEKTLIDLVTKSKELRELTDLLFQLKMRFIKLWLELDVDAVYFLDDWGTMRGLMIDPELWREHFKPLYKRMFDLVHRAGKHVFFHSDGYVLDIIPDFIEMGVDALNIQVRLIGAEKIGKRFGGRICILADIDRQGILPFGTEETVKAHVKEIIQAFSGFDGGLISWGEIGPDVPLTNARSMLETFSRHGRYPLS